MRSIKGNYVLLIIVFFLFVIINNRSFAEEQVNNTLDPKVVLDTLWVLITAFLVFWMNAGFACVEAGFCRAKNAVNILTKNFIVFGITLVCFWAVGFALMFGDGNPIIGLTGFFLSGSDNSPSIGDVYQGVYSSLNWTGVPLEAKFFFQVVFAGTSATIVSGAVAERIRFSAFLLFSVVISSIIYPIAGHWIWGGGWLSSFLGVGFKDFAGSTVVHSIGGWSALVGAWLLGPRLGKYGKKGEITPIPGHNLSLATLGALILWLGWFGFNPGSTMEANPAKIAHVALTTAMAASTGIVISCLYAWIRLGKPDLTMIINGSLAGLVAITAPCDGVSVFGSLIIGAIAGIIVVESVLFFDRIKVDDPVGAISVHLVNGIWGTLAVGLFDVEKGLLYGNGGKSLLVQLVGIIAVGIFVLCVSSIAWLIIRALIGLRVDANEEYLGLDQSEMGLEAYPEERAIPEYILAKDA
ncbi:MAG TPA: ammonium transporter [Candidatus Hydrogenedens sp.]|nr:ammonium transporter [Candidatus Hydrogenedens sp.]HOL20512.1 ammonium transporter [Candidatus Hydrogenedens sp.]HPP59977.1 ammonium transporter [Candidatus Hydrogenedens sp.]